MIRRKRARTVPSPTPASKKRSAGGRGVRASSSCASGSGRTSHVLKAIGLSDAQARSSIRLGWGRYTTMAELEEAIGAILEAAAAQD